MNTKGIYVNKILNLSVILLLAFAVVFSFGVRAFAYSNNDAGSSFDVPASELLDSKSYDPEILNLAKTIQASTATTYDLDDIYNIVNECANALVEYDGSEFVSVTEYVHACLTGIASGLFNGSSQNPYLGTINSNIASIQAAVYGPAWDGSGVTNSLWNALQTLYSVNHADQLAQMAKQQGIIDALVGNSQYSLSNILNSFKSANHSDLDKIYNRQATINTSINNLMSSFDSINWLTKSDSSVILRDKNYNTISSAGSYYPMYFTFTNLYEYPCIYRFHIYYTENYGNTSLNLQLGSFADGQFRPFNSDNIFYTYCASTLGYDIYVYSTGFAYTNYSINALTIKVDNGYLYQTNVAQRYIPFGSKDFNDTLVAMTNLSISKSNNHIDTDLHYQNNILDRFKQLYASDDLVQAKQAQQSVENAAILDFSGSGSASMKGSDVTSAKNISNQVKDGLYAGGSVSNGLSAFNSNNAFWGWFSSDCASYFVVDVPSDSTPQPVLRGFKSEWSDDVPDVISNIDEDYYSQLGSE